MIIHHISIVVRDLVRSALFYETVLGLTPTPRPPFRSKGLWLACGPQQVHLNEKPLPPMAGPLSMDPTGPHFAIRVDHFDREIARLTALGYHTTDAPAIRCGLFWTATAWPGFRRRSCWTRMAT